MARDVRQKVLDPAMGSASSALSRYSRLVEHIFFSRFEKGAKSVPFERADLETAAEALGMKLPKNLGDVIYAVRFRTPLPQSILDTQSEGLVWRIKLAGRAKYRFALGKENRIVPNGALVRIGVPDATPEIIAGYALNDEQALLAVVRYNRLIDVFLGLTTYSLQNHLRTTVEDIGQVEVDELYVGLDTDGCHYVIPVQAKGGKDQISVVQTEQDIALCAEKFPGVRCFPISVQFMEGGVIAMFLLKLQDDDLRVAKERHYRLVSKDDWVRDAIVDYRTGKD